MQLKDRHRRFNYCFLTLPYTDRLRLLLRYSVLTDNDDYIESRVLFDEEMVNRIVASPVTFELMWKDTMILWEAQQLRKELGK